MKQLTPTERLVLQPLLQGKTGKEIAAELGMTQRVIKFHIGNILQKTGQPSTKKLIAATKEGSAT